MVEEEEDIANVDMSKVSDDAATPPKKKEDPPQIKPQSSKSEAPKASGSAVGTSEFMEELDHIIHSGEFKIAPAAGWWLRTYMILPKEVKSTGPKGYILKGDVLKHIEDNKIQKGKRVDSPKTASKAATPKKSASSSTASPAYDPNDPF